MRYICTLSAILFFTFLSTTSFAAERPEVFVQFGHLSNIKAISFSPDGKYALSGSIDNTLKLWDVSTAREIRTFQGHSEQVMSVDFSSDGRYALSGSWDKTVKLWDVFTGKAVRTFQGHSAGVNSVAFSPDCKYALSGSTDSTLKLWDVSTAKEVRTFRGHLYSVKSVVFSPGGKHALSGSYDNTLKLWDISTGMEVRTFRGHSKEVKSVAFSPDGKYALSGSVDETLKLWDVASGKELMSLQIPYPPSYQRKLTKRREIFREHEFLSASFSPDNRYILSGSNDREMKLWDVFTGKEVRTFQGHSGEVNSVAFSPDSQYILSGSDDSTLKLWEVSTGKEVRTFQGHPAGVYSVAFSPDGLYALSGTPIMKLWEVSTGKEVKSFQGDRDHPVASAVFSPDGRYVLSSGSGIIKLWEITTGNEVRTFRGHKFVTFAAFSPDSRYILSGGALDDTLKLWEVSTGREVRTFKVGSSGFNYIPFSSDGRYVLTGSTDNNMQLLDVFTGNEIKTFQGHNREVQSAAFSPDSKYALSGSADKTIKFWAISTGKEMKTFKGHSQAVNSLVFSLDGRYVLSGGNDGAMKLWEVSTGREVRTFQGHSAGVYSVALSPDGRYAMSGSPDCTIRIWDISTGKELAKRIEFQDGEWVVITPDGYFNASKNGPSHLNVRLGNRVFGLDQFYDVFYRPDIVEAKLKGEDISTLAATNLELALKNPPPTVEFVNVPSKTGDEKVTIKYRITSTGGGIGEIRLFHNGKLIQSDGFYRQAKSSPIDKAVNLLAYDSRAIKDDLRSVTLVSKREDKLSLIESTPKGDVYEGTITVDAISGENDVGLAAFNKNNSVQSILKTATFNSTLNPEDPHLYVLSVGVDEYKAEENNLKYAVKDAESIAQKIQDQSKTQYNPENIHVTTIKNSDATKTNILNRINELSKTIKPNDVFVLFIASHGVLQSGLYSIVTHDYDGNLSNSNLINSNEIMEISKNMKALTQIFILDTCHAGGLDTFVSGLYDARMTVMARNMGLHMFASASSTQEAMDGYKGKNGIFTYTLLEGLNNNRNADTNKDNKVSIYELGSYAKEQTTKYSKETGHTQTPVVNNFGKDISVYVIR